SRHAAADSLILRFGGFLSSRRHAHSALPPITGRYAPARNRSAASLTVEDVLRAAVRALGLTGHVDGQEHARMGIPQTRPGHGAVQGQVRLRYLVAALRIGLLETDGIRFGHDAPPARCYRHAAPGRDGG